MAGKISPAFPAFEKVSAVGKGRPFRIADCRIAADKQAGG
jgi:hypothetical protein